MDLALLLARLVLAAVFIVAGLGKIADLAGSQQALEDFGVPRLLARPFGVLLPLAELAVGIALILPALVWWGALGAAALLFLFIIGIGYNLARGRTPDCHCFGQLHSAPAGWSTLARNVVLAAIAGFVVGLGRTSAGLDPFNGLEALAVTQRIELLVGVILLGLLVLESGVLLQIMRQQGRLLLRFEEQEAHLAAAGLILHPSCPTNELPIGSSAPTFRLTSLSSSSQSPEMVTLGELRAKGKPVVLIFSDPNCGPCKALLPEVSHWQRDYAAKLTLSLISRGTAEANCSKVSENEITQMLLQLDREVAEAYQVHATPSAVLVSPDGTIGSCQAQGAEAIRDLVTQAVSRPALRRLPMALPVNGNNGGGYGSRQPAGLKEGEPAPAFSLLDLSGKAVSLADFRGQKTLVLFWNPGLWLLPEDA